MQAGDQGGERRPAPTAQLPQAAGRQVGGGEAASSLRSWAAHPPLSKQLPHILVLQPLDGHLQKRMRPNCSWLARHSRQGATCSMQGRQRGIALCASQPPVPAWPSRVVPPTTHLLQLQQGGLGGVAVHAVHLWRPREAPGNEAQGLKEGAAVQEAHREGEPSSAGREGPGRYGAGGSSGPRRAAAAAAIPLPAVYFEACPRRPPTLRAPLMQRCSELQPPLVRVRHTSSELIWLVGEGDGGQGGKEGERERFQQRVRVCVMFAKPGA